MSSNTTASFPYKKILVIGATSGIGEALADKLVSEGRHVIVAGRRREKLDHFVESHGGAPGATAYTIDISDLEGIPEFAAAVTKEHPDLDCVILNSGIQRPFDFANPASVDLDVLKEEFTVNYLAYVYLTTALLPALQAHEGPTALVYTSSGLALVPTLRCGNYCASKAALHAWTLVLREQLRAGPGEVKVIELLPPAVQTELHDEKHQPDIKNGRNMGMPLREYIEETWKGLVEGKEQVPVGMAAPAYEAEGFETKRQQAFGKMMEGMKKQSK